MSLILGELEYTAMGTGRLDIVVPYTTAYLTRLALRRAGELATGIPSRIRLLRMQRVPFPLDMDQSPVSLEFLREQTRQIVRDMPASEVVIFLTRDPEETLLRALRRDSILVVASRRRWWRTAQERLKEVCARRGHRVALTYGE